MWRDYHFEQSQANVIEQRERKTTKVFLVDIGGLIAKTVLTLFSTRVKMSACANLFIELAPVLDATP